MGDDDNALAVITHTAEHSEQFLGLLRGQNSGRLVQNQDVCATVQNLDNFHGLLFGDTHSVDLFLGVNLKAVLLADLCHLLFSLFQVILTLFLQTQHNVLRCAEYIHQFEVLVDHADLIGKGILGGSNHNLLAIDEDLSFIGEIDAGDHIHKGGLATAVFAQNRENLPVIGGQANILIGYHLSAKGLGDIFQLDGRCFLQNKALLFLMLKNRLANDSPLFRIRIPKGGAGKTRLAFYRFVNYSP